MPDSLIEEKPWTLGEYIRQHGGNQNRSKKVWGICIPVGIEEEEGVSTSTDDPVSTLQCILDSCRVTIYCNNFRDISMRGSVLLAAHH